MTRSLVVEEGEISFHSEAARTIARLPAKIKKLVRASIAWFGHPRKPTVIAR